MVPVFVHFYPEWLLMLETDVLNGATAGFFFQKQPDKEWHSIAYYLKTIINAELNYSIYNKKMLAIIF